MMHPDEVTVAEVTTSGAAGDPVNAGSAAADVPVPGDAYAGSNPYRAVGPGHSAGSGYLVE